MTSRLDERLSSVHGHRGEIRFGEYALDVGNLLVNTSDELGAVTPADDEA